MLKKVSASSGIKFIVNVERINGVFSKEAEINLYRIVQESINNIVRHSQATEARVECKPRRARSYQTISARCASKEVNKQASFINQGGLT